MNNDLTKSHNVGVRWQAQMEAHLQNVRAFSNEAMLQGIDPDQAASRSRLAQAHATAALALAVANGLSDLELVI
jgi:hypothetical protein